MKSGSLDCDVTSTVFSPCSGVTDMARAMSWNGIHSVFQNSFLHLLMLHADNKHASLRSVRHSGHLMSTEQSSVETPFFS